MKYLIIKDKLNRLNYKKNEFKILINNSFKNENYLIKKTWVSDLNNLPNFIKFYKNRGVFLKCHIESKKLIKIKNRCIKSGRAKSINRKYKLSRIELKDFISKGLINGLKKKSW